MRVVFMGTPDFAVPVLKSVISSGSQVVGVFTQPDRPAGRRLEEAMPPVKRYALEAGLDVFQPTTLRSQEAQGTLESLKPDVVVVAAYGKILPPAVLALPRHGCLNIHPSLLPRHRGPSPVATAILDGDAVTGVTVMLMDEGMDSGPIVVQRRVEIESEETAATLTRRLFQIGSELLIEVLPSWCGGELQAVPQDSALATVTRKLEKADGEVDWGATAAELARRVRALDPWPGVFTRWKGCTLKVLEASAVSLEVPGGPGLVVAMPGGVGVVTGGGVLELKRIQLEGRRPLAAEEYVRGQRDFLGARLPS